MSHINYTGAIIGFAIGDALGMANEFSDNKVYDFEDNPKKGLKAGQWTDDTQYLIVSGESMIRYKSLCSNDLAFKLRELYHSGKLRSIGYGTRTAIQNMNSGLNPSESGITGQMSCGSSGLARIIPYSLVEDNPERCQVNSALKITHNNKDLFKVGYAFSKFLQGIKKRNIEEALNYFHEYTPKKLRKFLDKTYDNSGYAPALIGGAIQSFLLYKDDFEKAVIHSVNQRGDSDTRGSLTGLISGLYLGSGNIPNHFKNRLEEKDYLVDMSNELRRLHNETREEN